MNKLIKIALAGGGALASLKMLYEFEQTLIAHSLLSTAADSHESEVVDKLLKEVQACKTKQERKEIFKREGYSDFWAEVLANRDYHRTHPSKKAFEQNTELKDFNNKLKESLFTKMSDELVFVFTAVPKAGGCTFSTINQSLRKGIQELEDHGYIPKGSGSNLYFNTYGNLMLGPRKIDFEYNDYAMTIESRIRERTKEFPVYVLTINKEGNCTCYRKFPSLSSLNAYAVKKEYFTDHEAMDILCHFNESEATKVYEGDFGKIIIAKQLVEHSEWAAIVRASEFTMM